MTLPAAQSRSVGAGLHAVLHLDYPITSGKYRGKWGDMITETTLGGHGKHVVDVMEVTCVTTQIVNRYTHVN